MKKTELMDALCGTVEPRLRECEDRLQTLDRSAATERSALMIQKNFYNHALTFIGYAGRGEEFPQPFVNQLANLLAPEDELRQVYESADDDERPALSVYLYTMLFWRENFLIRYKAEAQNVTDPKKQVEISMKIRITEDLLNAYRDCYVRLGGRKELNV